MTTESQDLGLTSHLKDGAFYSIVSSSLYWGVRTHTDHRVSTPCWPQISGFNVFAYILRCIYFSAGKFWICIIVSQVLSVTSSYRNQLICWFGNQETFLIIIKVFSIVLLNIFMKTAIYYYSNLPLENQLNSNQPPPVFTLFCLQLALWRNSDVGPKRAYSHY